MKCNKKPKILIHEILQKNIVLLCFFFGQASLETR